MKPIYFPFTCMPLPVLDRLNFYFRPVVIYQPSGRKIPDDMASLADTGKFDIRLPVTGGEREIDAALADYNAWAALHAGGARALFKRRSGAVPFFQDSSTAQIKADIRGYAVSENSGKQDLTAAEMLFNARMFLLIAQQLDLQNADLSNRFERLNAMTASLFENLRGVEDVGLAANRQRSDSPREDARSYMLPQRIKAFARLAVHDPDASGFYVTDSRAAVDYLLARTPQVKALADITLPPPARDGRAMDPRGREPIPQLIEGLLATSWSECGDGLARLVDASGERTASGLRLYLVPGMAGPAFWAALAADGKGAASGMPSGGEPAANTLIGLVEG